MTFFRSSKKGFTIIELLVVISIIGALAVTGYSSYTNSIKKSYDARRKLDLEQVGAALEQYRSNSTTGTYPAASNYAGLDPYLVSGTQKYINGLPKDPVTKVDYTYVAGPSGCAVDACTTYTLSSPLTSFTPTKIFEVTPLGSKEY